MRDRVYTLTGMYYKEIADSTTPRYDIHASMYMIKERILEIYVMKSNVKKIIKLKIN